MVYMRVHLCLYKPQLGEPCMSHSCKNIPRWTHKLPLEWFSQTTQVYVWQMRKILFLTRHSIRNTSYCHNWTRRNANHLYSELLAQNLLQEGVGVGVKFRGEGGNCSVLRGGGGTRGEGRHLGLVDFDDLTVNVFLLVDDWSWIRPLQWLFLFQIWWHPLKV